MAYPPPKAVGTPEPEITTRLSASRKERLLNIKKREELKDVLLHKFKEKYGDAGSDAGIGDEVNRFVMNADVTENNLARLERRIQKRKKPADAMSCASSVSAYSSRSRASNASGRSNRSGRLAASRSMPNVGAKMAPIPEGDAIDRQMGTTSAANFRNFDWSKLDDYASYLHEQDSLRQQAATKEMQHRLRMDLDKQVADQRRKKLMQREEEKRYFSNQMVEIEQWKVMEVEREKEVKAKNIKEKIDRDEQLAFEKRRRDAELVKTEAEEKALVEKIQREMAQEKARAATKKIQQKEAMMRIMVENVEENKIKEAGREKQAALEIEGMREYNKILDQQEADRAEKLEQRIARQKMLMDKMKETVQKQQSGANAEDARRALKQKEEADARAIEMERNKEAKLRQMRLETQDFLFAQMDEKEGRKEQAYELKRLQAHILDADTKEYGEMEKARAVERKRQNLEHRIELDAQMAYKRAQKSFTMSDNEVHMNRQLLEVVNKTLDERDEYASPGAMAA
jgi:hypothetical protein